ncbi:Uncharacterised protein [Vibrio cholerae]|uniref:Transposase n=1 Tax=Vibrio cholerae TaxID=666 RepID=A0A655W1F7_VIBCL|nr:Uncharacterised protein [Vibrio cholerae]
MQHHTANQLYIKMAHAEHTLRRFAHGGKSFWQQLIKVFSLFNALTELDSFGF